MPHLTALAVIRVTAVAAIVAAGCSSPAPTNAPATAQLSASPSPTFAPFPSPLPTLGSIASLVVEPTGFAFDVESVAGYYASLGYSCTEPQPSIQAAGHLFRSCELVDPVGRTLVVGLVTDPSGGLANAFASVTGTEAEDVLEPVDALDPLAAFLGAMLGPGRGEALLPWLAGHLGDEMATTTVDALTVATYTESADDHSRLYVELATPEYLEAPTPS